MKRGTISASPKYNTNGCAHLSVDQPERKHCFLFRAFALSSHDFLTVKRERPGCAISRFIQRTPWGGAKERGGRKTSRRRPLPKEGFGPPFVWYVSTPLRCRCSSFSFCCTAGRNIFEESDNFQEGTFSGIFSSPHIVGSPPPIMAQFIVG